MTEDFGVVVTCCVGDYMFAKGCCASIRYFMGDVPLCLLIDGEFPLEGLPELYGAKIIRKQDVRAPFLQSRSYGWGTTKMIALWESPFEYFLLMDADTIVWGDVRKHASFDTYDVILHDHGEWNEDQVSKWFFNVESVRASFPTFSPMSHGYANTGVMFMRRGIFELREYQEMLDFVQAHPGMFFPGEQGFLNFMLFRAFEEGRIRLGHASLQYIVGDHEIESTKAKFGISNGKPLVENEPMALHWCGLKPFIGKKVPMFIEPMTFFRKQCLRDTGLMSEQRIARLLQKEEKKLDTRLLFDRLTAQSKNTLKSCYFLIKRLQKGSMAG